MRIFENLLNGPYKRWVQFGWHSPNILYRRMRGKYRPFWRIRMRWQRSKRGWSEEDSWGLHSHLEDIIIGAVSYWRTLPPHGYPATDSYDPKTGEYSGNTLGYEEWLVILDEIVLGMKAAKTYSEEWEWPEGGEVAFNLAMDHLKIWWLDLWD